MAQPALAFARPYEPIEYPESDGTPMGETDKHRKELAESVQTLDWHFRHREDVYVSGNLFFYYKEGDPGACKAPDVFVALGVPKHDRRSYKLWEEGEVPTLVVELTSKKTKKEDEEIKPKVYASLGIPFLYLCDPYAEYLDPPFQGFELGNDGEYHPMPGPKGGPFPCLPLGIDLFRDKEGRLQFLDRKTREVIRRMPAALDHAEALRVGAEAARVQEKIARLGAIAERERESEARKTAEREKQEAKREKQKETQARLKVEDDLRKAQEEIERLRRLLPGE